MGDFTQAFDMPLWVSILAALGVGTAFLFMFDRVFNYETVLENQRTEDGEVIDLSYKSEEHDTSLVPTYTNGNFGIGVSSHDTPERYIVVVRGSKEVKKVIIDDEDFYDAVKQGQSVQLMLVDEHLVRKGSLPNRENLQQTNLVGIRVNGIELDPSVLELKLK